MNEKKIKSPIQSSRNTINDSTVQSEYKVGNISFVVTSRFLNEAAFSELIFQIINKNEQNSFSNIG